MGDALGDVQCWRNDDTGTVARYSYNQTMKLIMLIMKKLRGVVGRITDEPSDPWTLHPSEICNAYLQADKDPASGIHLDSDSTPPGKATSA